MMVTTRRNKGRQPRNSRPNMQCMATPTSHPDMLLQHHSHRPTTIRRVHTSFEPLCNFDRRFSSSTDQSKCSSPELESSSDHNEDSMMEEILRFSEEKRRETMKDRGADEEQWRESIRHQLETELDQRVREALETPPLSRPRDASGTKRAGLGSGDHQGRDVADLERLNAHIQLDLTEKEHEYMKNKKWKVLQAKRKIRRMLSQTNMEFATSYKTEVSVNPEYLIRHMTYDPETENDYAGLFSFDGLSGAKTQAHYAAVSKKALANFGALSTAERHEFFYAFTKSGFKEAIRTGKLPDGSDLVSLGNGKYKDKHGIIRDEHGPFWPPDHGPLFPTPIFCKESLLCEPLIHEESDKDQPTVETQETPYTNRWRGIQIVYDSEKSAKDYEPPPVTEGHCPSLTFESRFESGNLRQARRVGQFDYELVLKTDLYTTRHTQWFYFRVKNAIPGVTYRFKIVNLLKRDSLYNYGMRPILYSEKNAKHKGIGWKRVAHHINYTRNTTNLNCPLLTRDRSFYMLEWQMEFPNADDTCYLAHCYPYSYTDLKDDLDDLLANPKKCKVMKREVMCETKAGNSCFLVTVTNFEQPEDENKKKKAIIVSARVHPGETNASWMMKGVLDFITGSSVAAKELREKFIFKIVPMLNPDGVIVGNYRCSLAARDLNRNYRHPRKEGFPTVWHIKHMMDELSHSNDILIYCDLHGHSRKQNVFMYGCNTSKSGATPALTQDYLKERLFPWLMSQKAPDKFSFRGCKFQIKRCKESTGRVVMFRQLKIQNSFTMEATFCGTTISKGERRHFNIADFQSMGHTFCQSVLDYDKMLEDKEKEAAVVLELTRSITQQVLESRGMLPQHLPDISTESGREQLKVLCNDPKLATSEQFAAAFMKLVKIEYQKEMKAMGQRSAPEPVRKAEEKSLRRERTVDITRLDMNRLMDAMSGRNSFDGCVSILEQLEVSSTVCESDSSDSDSESEPEMKYVEPKQKKKKKSKKKRVSQQEMHKEDKKKNSEKSEQQRPSSTSALPAINNDESHLKKKRSQNQDMKKYVKNFKNYPGFVNKYEGRSNGGIPCFSEERLNERAAKRMAEMKKKEEERDVAPYNGLGTCGNTEDEFPHQHRGGHASQLLRSFSHAEMQLQQVFSSSTMPPYIRTGYMHAEMGGISDHHISDNSSDSESDDEHKRMPIAAIHSPYQQYSSPHLFHHHSQHGQLLNNSSNHSTYQYQQNMHGAGLSHSAGQSNMMTPRVNRLPTLNHKITSPSLMMESVAVPLRQSHMMMVVPNKDQVSSADRLNKHQSKTFSSKIGALVDDENPQQKDSRHPIMSREYTDMLLQRLRSHKQSFVQIPNQLIAAGGSRHRSERKIGERHSTCE